jgi:hypothetical protein
MTNQGRGPSRDISPLPKTGLTDICEVPAYAKHLAHTADVAVDCVAHQCAGCTGWLRKRSCCAALIGGDGTMTIANAGHLAPYLNGKELTIEGGLPLGIVEEGSYQETSYPLAAGDRLTFISDGVVEATNEKKELFGFERVQAISNQPAQAVATAAQNFGQEDDISVLSVTRIETMKAELA